MIKWLARWRYDFLVAKSNYLTEKALLALHRDNVEEYQMYVESRASVEERALRIKKKFSL